ncbi:MAG: hypothetical protein WCV63_11025 [Negativicutes bacterium]|jgi:hypothetical protein
MKQLNLEDLEKVIGGADYFNFSTNGCGFEFIGGHSSLTTNWEEVWKEVEAAKATDGLTDTQEKNLKKIAVQTFNDLSESKCSLEKYSGSLSALDNPNLDIATLRKVIK